MDARPSGMIWGPPGWMDVQVSDLSDGDAADERGRERRSKQ